MMRDSDRVCLREESAWGGVGWGGGWVGGGGGGRGDAVRRGYGGGGGCDI